MCCGCAGREVRDDRWSEYLTYMASPAWRALREEIYARDGRRCARCSSVFALEVAHLTYERFGAEDPADLLTLCHTCHARMDGRDPGLRGPVPPR